MYLRVVKTRLIGPNSRIFWPYMNWKYPLRTKLVVLSISSIISEINEWLSLWTICNENSINRLCEKGLIFIYKQLPVNLCSQRYIQNSAEHLIWSSLLKAVKYFCKKLELRCLTGSWMGFWQSFRFHKDYWSGDFWKFVECLAVLLSSLNWLVKIFGRFF